MQSRQGLNINLGAGKYYHLFYWLLTGDYCSRLWWWLDCWWVGHSFRFLSGCSDGRSPMSYTSSRCPVLWQLRYVISDLETPAGSGPSDTVASSLPTKAPASSASEVCQEWLRSRQGQPSWLVCSCLSRQLFTLGSHPKFHSKSTSW